MAGRRHQKNSFWGRGGGLWDGEGGVGPAADNTKTPPFGGGGGGVGAAADDTKTPQLWGTGGKLWGGTM